MKSLLFISLLMAGAFASAKQFQIQGCEAQLSYDIFSGDCDGHPCEVKNVPLGTATFDMSFVQETRRGTGAVTVVSVDGTTVNAALDCHPHRDQHWISCDSKQAVLEGKKIFITTNVNGIGSSSDPDFFMPIFLDGFNAPNGVVQTEENCAAIIHR